MSPEQLQQFEEIMNWYHSLSLVDRYMIQKLIQMADGRNIQLGRKTGTQIGTAADQKLGFWGVTPVVQPGAISAPASAGSSYSQSQINAMVTSITQILTALASVGIIA